MEYRASLDNQISGPAKAAAGDLRALQGAALAASEAIKSIPSAAPALPGAATGAGRGIPSAKPANDNSATKAAPKVVINTDIAAKTAADKITAGNKLAAAGNKLAEKDWKGLQRAKEKAAKAEEAEDIRLAKEAERRRTKDTAAAKKKWESIKPYMLAAGAAVGIASAAGIASLALGYKGMARLSMITARAGLDFRRLFSQVNPTPALDALAKFERNFSTTTSTGRVLQAVLTRTFDGFFKAVSAAEPYATAFLQGAIGAALTLEVAWLKARIALFPLTEAIGKVTGEIDGLGMASTLGGGALVALGAWALWTAAPFIALAGAIGAVTAALDQAIKLSREWDDESGGQIWRKLKSDLGVAGSQADKDKDQGIISGADYDNVSARKAHAARTAQAKTSGVASGKALGDGLVVGMGATEAAVAAAGGKLATAADKGVKLAAKIKSPSRLMRERGGQMGEGAALGIEDKGPRVQEAADRALVPAASPGGGRGGGGAGGGGITIAQIGPFIIEGNAGKTGDLEAILRAKIPQIADEILRRIALELQGGLAA